METVYHCVAFKRCVNGLNGHLGEQWLGTVGLDLMGWTSPGGAAHVHCCGYLGLYPPQLVLERLVSAEQRRLEQVRAI